MYSKQSSFYIRIVSKYGLTFMPLYIDMRVGGQAVRDDNKRILQLSCFVWPGVLPSSLFVLSNCLTFCERELSIAGNWNQRNK